MAVVWRCPFCLSDKVSVLSESTEDFSVYSVLCNECSATGPPSNTEEVAIEKWNSRGDQRQGWTKDSAGQWHYIEKGKSLCGKLLIAVQVPVLDKPGRGTRCIHCVADYIEKG